MFANLSINTMLVNIVILDIGHFKALKPYIKARLLYKNQSNNR